MPGHIVFVVGPSGAGKDSLLRYGAAKLAGDERYVFPRRAITRQAADETELHNSITADEFGQTAESGGFALHWEAHGLCYGIPSSIDADLAVGRVVAANISRNILASAMERYPDHLIVSVTAPPALLAKRLAARGRESGTDILARVSRETAKFPAGSKAVTIVNDGPLEIAGDRFVALLRNVAEEDGCVADSFR